MLAYAFKGIGKFAVVMFPWQYSENVIPVGVVGFLLAGLLAAFMSNFAAPLPLASWSLECSLDCSPIASPTS